MRTIAALFLGSTLLFGCSSTYQHTPISVFEGVLDPQLAVLISVPKDGWYDTQNYRNSGRMTANAVRAAFMKHASKVTVTDRCKGESCLSLEGVGEYGYYVKPQILHWEERATEWSGLPDRIEIKLTIYDMKTAKPISSNVYTGKSKWLTFGGDHPQDLLPGPTNSYVTSLYQ
ncbi:DUF4823 domain-containing protein [Ferrimonas kyonanensis]|uniref:DUF4823 domain-containing protein n=1 Tax=Ferrimonas kyonanensis TaxID=364763 RepID=UPI0004867CF1|nr:DUF4823 domain-containing protein [Ferrimonas kyonanensis]